MEQTLPARPQGKREWTFFAIMSLVVAAVVAAGFGPSYAANLAPPGLPFWVHLHGAVMASWIVLFAVQAALVRRRSLPLHRVLGFASIGLVITMVPLGIATDLLAIHRGATPPMFTPAAMFSADLCDVLLFAGLFAWALTLRHRRDWHKRLLLCATVLLTWPAIGRLSPLRHFGLTMIVPISIALLIGLALIGPLHDLVTRRRIHPAYVWGVGLRGSSGNLNSGDKWIADATAAMLAASRRQDEQATAPEPQPGVQSEGGVGRREGREDAGRVGAAV